MFRAYNQTQTFLLPPNLEDFIKPMHPARLINDLVEKLDVNALMRRYGVMGQPAYAVRLMLKVILYGCTVGIFSSRKLTRACQENLAFKYLAGMEEPTFKTFIEFRKRHQEDMKGVFVQTVKLAKELGLALFREVALDGTKIDADTSKHKAMSYGRMQEEEKRLKEQIERLLKQGQDEDAEDDEAYGAEHDGYSLPEDLSRAQERLKKIEEAKAALEAREAKDHPGEKIDPKKQISFADKEARCFAQPGQGTRYIYNSQATVDMDRQIIVENHIEDSVTDASAVEPTLEGMANESGIIPDKMAIDGGYANQATLESCESRGVTPVCAATQEKTTALTTEKKAGDPVRKPSTPITAFSYDRKANTLQCPHGVEFLFDHWNSNGMVATYRSSGPLTCACATRVLKDGQAVREVDKSHLARRRLQEILQIPENQKLYGHRKTTVEPVFGQIKQGMGFRRYQYRGIDKVASQWDVVCAAFNLKKISALLSDTPGFAVA
jgi:transposase